MHFNSFRLCNDQGFYHGKALTYTGIYGPNIIKTPGSLSKIVGNRLGASYKYRLSNGCIQLIKDLPKPHNTLGLVKKYLITFVRKTLRQQNP